MSSRGSIPPLRANYDALLGFSQEILGLDPMIFVNIGLILGAAAAFFHYIGRTVYRWASRICLSSIHINDDDKLFVDLMRWMSDFELESRRFRSVKATTAKDGKWEDEDKGASRPLRADRLISYRALVNRIPIKLAPFEAGHVFRFQGHWLFFSHKLHRMSPIDEMMGAREKGYITVKCLGRSLAPLRALLEAVQAHSLSISRASTTIHRALPQRGDRLSWAPVVKRPARDIRTVVLPRQTKADLLADVNEYLHPHTRRWYADHGVPYRRGYLFSGAPGTGKTSLTAAMAGVFGLDIYVVSLLDTALTEAVLMRLLADLPTRCIVLLEDVDAAGLENRGSAATSSAANPATASTRVGGGMRGARGASRAQQNDDSDPTKALNALARSVGTKAEATGISLSGLLNAIDGVSSAEGRILVLTTNAEAALDPALIRPGRIDMHVAFELPRAAEARELFVSMYRDTEDGSSTDDEAGEKKKDNGAHTSMNGTTTKSFDSAQSKKQKKKDPVADGDDEEEEEEGHRLADLAFHPSERLAALADRFAAAVPEATLSLAAMQGFLLRHKRDPDIAVAEAPDWARDTIERLRAAEEREAEAEAKRKEEEKDVPSGKDGKKDGDDG